MIVVRGILTDKCVDKSVQFETKTETWIKITIYRQLISRIIVREFVATGLKFVLKKIREFFLKINIRKNSYKFVVLWALSLCLFVNTVMSNSGYSVALWYGTGSRL